MLYRPEVKPASPAVPVAIKAPPRQVSGRNLAHGKRTPVERAFLAADIAAGRVVVVNLTARQVATMLKTNQVYVDAARRLSHAERSAVLDGLRPLIIKPAKRSAPSDAEILVGIVACHGVDRTLEMIVAAEVAAAA
jgi:hypothetical protein